MIAPHHPLQRREGRGMTHLLPCPFCGADEDELMVFCDHSEATDNSGPSRRIQCAGCNVEAPYYPTKEDAAGAWNTRAHPHSSQPVEVSR